MGPLLEGVYANIVAGIVLYAAGVFTGKAWNLLMRKKNETRLKNNVRIALSIIYEAEEKFVGRKRGVERLEYATKKFMKDAKIRDYESAQKKIIEVFNLTKLSKEDFLPTTSG